MHQYIRMALSFFNCLECVGVKSLAFLFLHQLWAVWKLFHQLLSIFTSPTLLCGPGYAWSSWGGVELPKPLFFFDETWKCMEFWWCLLNFFFHKINEGKSQLMPNFAIFFLIFLCFKFLLHSELLFKYLLLLVPFQWSYKMPLKIEHHSL